MRGTGECLAAVPTHVGPFPRVDPPMQLHIAQPAERFITVCTRVRSLPRVQLRMGLKLTRGPESFLTVRTTEGFLS